MILGSCILGGCPYQESNPDTNNAIEPNSPLKSPRGMERYYMTRK